MHSMKSRHSAERLTIEGLEAVFDRGGDLAVHPRQRHSLKYPFIAGLTLSEAVHYYGLPAETILQKVAASTIPALRIQIGGKDPQWLIFPEGIPAIEGTDQAEKPSPKGGELPVPPPVAAVSAKGKAETALAVPPPPPIANIINSSASLSGSGDLTIAQLCKKVSELETKLEIALDKIGCLEELAAASGELPYREGEAKWWKRLLHRRQAAR